MFACGERRRQSERMAARKASECLGSRAILARDGLVCREILPFGGDDDDV
jgi:hypothetical protein